MKKKTLKALNESIEHWYRISECTTKEELAIEGYGGYDCPLCELFAPFNAFNPTDSESGECCRGCPVYEAIGKDLCRGTPYSAASRSLIWWSTTGKWSETDQNNIKAEIRFLESLLPRDT